MRTATLTLCAAALLGCCTNSLRAQAPQENNRLIESGLYFLDVPYVAHTLEVNGNAEALVINTDEMDCTTFLEYALALATANRLADGEIDENDFFERVQHLRYRDGRIDGYPSRLHYFTDWIDNAVTHGCLTDVAAEHSPSLLTVNLSYMTTHPNLYPQLASSPDNVAAMRHIEQSLTGKQVHYLPKSELTDYGPTWIKSGDVIAITTDIPGLDVSHVGIAHYVAGKLTLLHASSREKKVALSGVTLAELLRENPHSTGVRVLRLKE
jgi:hypothetical protein